VWLLQRGATSTKPTVGKSWFLSSRVYDGGVGGEGPLLRLVSTFFSNVFAFFPIQAQWWQKMSEKLLARNRW
jgi:hypothetical protein